MLLAVSFYFIVEPYTSIDRWTLFIVLTALSFTTQLNLFYLAKQPYALVCIFINSYDPLF